MFVVVGATGQTGSAVVNRLLAKGRPVRAIVRQTEQAERFRVSGTEAFVADAADAAALTRAMAGATAVYFMNPPAYMAADLFARARDVHAALVKAAETAQVGRVVALSSVGAQHVMGTGNILTTHDLETQLKHISVPVTILRASNFIENWGWVLRSVLEQSILHSMFLPLDRKLPMQSVADVGFAAAELMIEDGAKQRIVELHGPQDYSPNDAAEVLSILLGRQILAAAVPEHRWPSIYESQGFPPVTVTAFCDMFRGFNTGHVVFESVHETRRGSTALRDALGELIAMQAHAN